MPKVRINTNLSNAELSVIGEGLIAKSQHVGDYVTENSAEEELLRRASASFDAFISSLQDAFESEIIE